MIITRLWSSDFFFESYVKVVAIGDACAPNLGLKNDSIFAIKVNSHVLLNFGRFGHKRNSAINNRNYLFELFCNR